MKEAKFLLNISSIPRKKGIKDAKMTQKHV